MGKRARKIHQRKWSRENPPICSCLIFSSRLETCCTEITLFSPEVRLDMTVVSGARCVRTGPMKGEEPARGRQLPAAARGSEPLIQPPLPVSSEHTQEFNPSGKFIISIHQRQTFRMNRGPCVPWPTPKLQRRQRGPSEGWGSALDIGHLCLVLINFSPRSLFSFSLFFPPRILPLLPSLEYCGVLLFFLLNTFPLTIRMNSAGCISGVSGI